jgi:hypothetical protein
MAGLNLFTNNAATLLASGILSGDTSLTVSTGTGALFPNPTAGQYFYCTLANNAGTTEIIKVTARSGDTFTTIVRGQDGTSAVAWNSGDKVELRLVNADLVNFGQLDSTNTWAAAQTFSQTITGSITGNAGTVTNGVYTSGSYSDPVWLTSLAGSKVTSIPNSSLQNSSITINSSPVALGGSTTIPVGGNYVMSTYVSPATWTKPADLKAIKVTISGGGGAGGTSPSAAPSPGVPGGGGGFTIGYIPAPSIPGPVAITAGPGTNSFGAFCSATGGSNGGPSVPVANPAPGGSGTGGLINFTGANGAGTGSPRGFSYLTQHDTLSGPSGAGYLYGGGGAAAKTPAVGGSGAPGIVIIEEFY